MATPKKAPKKKRSPPPKTPPNKKEDKEEEEPLTAQGISALLITLIMSHVFASNVADHFNTQDNVVGKAMDVLLDPAKTAQEALHQFLDEGDKETIKIWDELTMSYITWKNYNLFATASVCEYKKSILSTRTRADFENKNSLVSYNRNLGN
jgi:hypothetical protein